MQRSTSCAVGAVGLFLTEAEETYTEKVPGSTRQELPAQTAEYSQHVVIVIKKHEFQKQRFQSAVWTITIRPGLSADSTSSCPHYILWPLEHFVGCCQRVSSWKRPKPALTGGWQVGWRCQWIKSVGADIPLLDSSLLFLSSSLLDMQIWRDRKIKHVKWSRMKEYMSCHEVTIWDLTLLVIMSKGQGARGPNRRFITFHYQLIPSDLGRQKRMRTTCKRGKMAEGGGRLADSWNNGENTLV